MNRNSASLALACVAATIAGCATLAPRPVPDSDGDGVPDARDPCPGTPRGEAADASGCSASQRDGDGDGVSDRDDKCPGFDDRIDRDGDGTPDGCDVAVLVDGLGSVSEAADGLLTAAPAEKWRLAGWVVQGEFRPAEAGVLTLRPASPGAAVVARFRFAWPEGVEALDAWLEAHERVAEALIWQAPGGCKGGCAWPWPAAAQDELFRAFARTWAGEPSGLPDPAPNVADVSDPEKFTRQSLAGDDARALFAAYAAGSLCSEIKGGLPWSILGYGPAELRVLLDSREFWTLVVTEATAGAVPSPGPVGSYQMSISVSGQSLPTTPERSRRFLEENGILDGSRLATIGRMIEWFTCGSPGCDSSSAGAIHFMSHWYNWNAWAHWQYLGHVPASRLMDGTRRLADEAHGAAADARTMHRTAGCWGTVGFMRSVLRAANIPVVREACGGHACVGFPTEGLHMSHGDDPYNMLVKRAFLRNDALRNVPAIDVACREAGGGDACGDIVFGDALRAAWFLPPPGATTTPNPTQEDIERAFFDDLACGDLACGDLEGQEAYSPRPRPSSSAPLSTPLTELNVGRRPREEHGVRWLSGYLLDQRCKEMGLGADAATNMGLRDWTPDELRSHPLGNLYERLDKRNLETKHCH